MVNVTVEVVGRGEREIAVRVELSTTDIADSATGKSIFCCSLSDRKVRFLTPSNQSDKYIHVKGVYLQSYTCGSPK